MDISKIKLVWKYLFGGVEGVVDYILDIINKALASLKDATKEKVQAVLNIVMHCFNVLRALSWLVPTKWQTAYALTLAAVENAIAALQDLNITEEEVKAVAKKVAEAIDAWKSPDDETCVEMA